MPGLDDYLRKGYRQGLYTVEAPWKGPILGDRVEGSSRVNLGGASNPAIGKALAAALIPVVRSDDGSRFVPAGAVLEDVAWLHPLECDDKGWFSANLDPDGFNCECEGVLMVLLYNEWKFDPASPPSQKAPLDLAVELAQRGNVAARGPVTYAFSLRVLTPLEPSVRRAILAPLDDLLQRQSIRDLRPALVEWRTP